MRLGFSMLAGAAALLFAACGARVDLDVPENNAAPRQDAGADGPVIHTKDATADVVEEDAAPTMDAAPAPDVYVPQAPHCPAQSDAGVPTAYMALMTPTVGELPQVVRGTGNVIAQPQFVSITFDGDPLADVIDDFMASVECTDHWRTALADYGVGDGYLLKAVRLKGPLPSTVDDSTISGDILPKGILSDELPPNGPDVVYDFFFPDGVTVTLMGAQSCQQFGGYHFSTTVQNGMTAAYTVVPRCQMNQFTTLENTTISASHEMAEAVTDPTPINVATYEMTDDNHPGWDFVGAEIGDMCEFALDSYYTPQGFPWMVQRLWSNRAAYSGANPCVPAATSDFFWAAPLVTDTTQIDLGMGPQTVAVVHVPVGQTGTVPVQFAGNVMQAMTLQALDAAQFLGGSIVLQLSLDNNFGPPGTMANLKITKTGPSMMGAEPFVLVASMGGKQVIFWAICSD